MSADCLLLGCFLSGNALLLLNLRHGFIMQSRIAFSPFCLLLFTQSTLALVHENINARPCTQSLLCFNHLCVVLLHGCIVVGIGFLLCLYHCHWRTFKRRGFLGWLFLLQSIKGFLCLLHLRIDNGCGIRLISTRNLVERIKSCLLIGFLKHRFLCLLVDGNTLQCCRLTICLIFLALLLLLQHLLIVLLQLLNLLLRKRYTVFALCCFIESTSGILMQLLVSHGLLYILALILYIFGRFGYAFLQIWYTFPILCTTKYGFMLGLNVCVCLIEFCLRVDGLTKREQLVRAGKLILASLCITYNNTLIRIAHVNARTIGERNNIALYDIDRLVVHFHGGWLHNTVVLVGVSLHIGGNLPALVFQGIVRCILHTVHCSLGIDVVEHSVPLVVCQFWVVGQCPRIIFHFCHAHFCVRAKCVLTFLVCLLHTNDDGINISFRVRIALLHLFPQQT